MRILLIGSGGREHALAWKISQSISANPLFIAPGNPGTEQCGINVELDINNFDAIGEFCTEEKIEMIIVGPEDLLVKGLFDYFKSNRALEHIRFIGPSKEGAQLEGSKAFAKEFMRRHNIPTADYREFNISNYEEGIDYIKNHSLPVVLKADGLAAGKGVMVCQNEVEALAEFELMVQQDKFGEAGKTVVVEEFLSGIECSVFVITDGQHYRILPEAKDYKRIGKGDTGLNTGGMGAISPVPFVTADFMRNVEEKIIKPTVDGIYKEGINYTGFIFFGLISVGGEPYVIEYNCRMGDPETEVVMARLQSDLVDLCIAATDKKLDAAVVAIDPHHAATIMAVSKGYPLGYNKGYPISGLQGTDGKKSLLFHAGTIEKDGHVVTNGGRVLCVTSTADTLQDAVNASREALENIHFEGMYYRTDIGYEFLS
jgi:phosphoribosylamine--glycine ligase